LKKSPPDERTLLRDYINEQAMLARCEEITEEQLLDADILDRGDFIVARIVWNEDKEQFHDHFAIIQSRCKLLHCLVFE